LNYQDLQSFEIFLDKLQFFDGLRHLVIEENPFVKCVFEEISPKNEISMKMGFLETLDGMKLLDYIKIVSDEIELREIKKAKEEKELVDPNYKEGQEEA
jgi:hypothetical protein